MLCCIKSEKPGESVNRQGDNPDASVCVGQRRSAVENWLPFLHKGGLPGRDYRDVVDDLYLLLVVEG